MMYKIKQTPCITDDADTICFMKYFLHNRVKTNLIKEMKYDEVMSISELIDEFKGYEELRGRENVTPSQSTNKEEEPEEKSPEKKESPMQQSGDNGKNETMLDASELLQFRESQIN